MGDRVREINPTFHLHCSRKKERGRMPLIERERGVCLPGWHEGKSRKLSEGTFSKKFFLQKKCAESLPVTCHGFTQTVFPPFASVREIFQASSPARKMTKLNFRKRGFSVLRAEEGKMPPLRSFARQRWHHQLLNPLTLPRASPSTFDLTKKVTQKILSCDCFIATYLRT